MLQEMTSEDDIVKANSEQHDAFQSRLGIYNAYVCSAKYLEGEEILRRGVDTHL